MATALQHRDGTLSEKPRSSWPSSTQDGKFSIRVRLISRDGDNDIIGLRAIRMMGVGIVRVEGTIGPDFVQVEANEFTRFGGIDFDVASDGFVESTERHRHGVGLEKIPCELAFGSHDSDRGAPPRPRRTQVKNDAHGSQLLRRRAMTPKSRGPQSIC